MLCGLVHHMHKTPIIFVMKDNILLGVNVHLHASLRYLAEFPYFDHFDCVRHRLLLFLHSLMQSW